MKMIRLQEVFELVAWKEYKGVKQVARDGNTSPKGIGGASGTADKSAGKRRLPLCVAPLLTGVADDSTVP
jgi:hypothetical protein